MGRLLVFVALLQVFYLTACAKRTARGHTRDLIVDVPLVDEHIEIDGEVKRYMPVGLEPHWSYEMRVSFVSTRAAQIHFGFDCGDSSIGRRVHRMLLHAEKIMFETDESGRIRNHPDCALTMWVTSWGQMRTETRGEFFYDIVLEKNVLGIPVSGLPLIVYGIVVVLAIMVFSTIKR